MLKAKSFDPSATNIAYYTSGKSMSLAQVIKDEISVMTQQLGITPDVSTGQVNVVQQSTSAKSVLLKTRPHNFHSVLYTNVNKSHALGNTSNIVLHLLEENGKLMSKKVLYSKG